MKNEKYILARDSNGIEYKTQLNEITEPQEIIDILNANDQLHDWSLEYYSRNGDKATVTVKSYENPTIIHFCLDGVVSENINIDLHIGMIGEVNIKISENIKISFVGVGIDMTAKKMTLKIQRRIF